MKARSVLDLGLGLLDARPGWRGSVVLVDRVLRRGSATFSLRPSVERPSNDDAEHHSQKSIDEQAEHHGAPQGMRPRLKLFGNSSGRANALVMGGLRHGQPARDLGQRRRPMHDGLAIENGQAIGDDKLQAALRGQAPER